MQTEDDDRHLQKDYSCAAGAHQLAKMITEYWHSLGFYGIECRVDTDNAIIRPTVNNSIYPVVSNIGPDGFPPRSRQGTQDDVAGAERIELPTPGFGGPRSSTELHP